MSQPAANNSPSPERSSASPGRCPHIRLVDLHKSFGSLVVFNGINVTVFERECVVILGPSGTGKSVLLKHIVGLLCPDSGEVYFRDRRVDHLSERQLEPIRKRFGVLFQGGALFDSMT